MKIHLCSDLHHEFGIPYIPAVEADVIVIAGDVDNITNRLCRTLNEIAMFYRHVIFITGNHEYYRNDIDKTNSEIESNIASNIHFLQNEYLVIDNITFYGGTMWTDGYGNHDMVLEDSINDFRIIRNFSVARMRLMHEEFKRNFIRSADVVVTHHMPDPILIADMFKGSPVNGAFCAYDMADYIGMADYWFYGHTHFQDDRVYKNTRFVCNPKGYEISPGFDRNLIIEV